MRTQDMEDVAAKMQEKLAAVAMRKREALASISAADCDVFLWEQRLQQESDMQVRIAGLLLPQMSRVGAQRAEQPHIPIISPCPAVSMLA